MKKKLLGSSPRTTLMGYSSAIWIGIRPTLDTGHFDLERDWKSLVLAAFIAAWGRFQKDSDGLTKVQDDIVAKAATNGAIPPAKK